MNNNTRSLLAFTVIVAVTTTSACHFADVEALEQHMMRECFTVPLAPSCATFQLDREEQTDLVFQRFASRSVTRPETEQCILAVDCSDERRDVDNAGMIDDLNACIDEDPGAEAIAAQRRARDADCLTDCDFSLMDCGVDDDDCDVLTISECYATHEACISSCPSA